MKITTNIQGWSKQPYSTPRLELYGNIQQLTQSASGKGGGKNDGNSTINTKAG